MNSNLENLYGRTDAEDRGCAHWRGHSGRRHQQFCKLLEISVFPEGDGPRFGDRLFRDDSNLGYAGDLRKYFSRVEVPGKSSPPRITHYCEPVFSMRAAGLQLSRMPSNYEG